MSWRRIAPRMDYSKIYDDANKTAKPDKREPLVLPKTKDVKAIAEAGADALIVQLIQDAYLSDNIPQKLSVLKECLDRRYGKAEQSVTAKVEVVRPEKSLEEIARLALFAMRAAQQGLPAAVIIDA